MTITCEQCSHRDECSKASRCIEPSTVEAAIYEVTLAAQDMKRASERLYAAHAAFEALSAIENSKRA